MENIEILTTLKEPEIDWDTPQWVQNVSFPTSLVLTTGEHAGDYFEGTILPCSEYENGGYDCEWQKRNFKKIPENGLIIKISN